MHLIFFRCGYLAQQALNASTHHWSLLWWDAASQEVLVCCYCCCCCRCCGALSCRYCSIINLSSRFITQQLLSVKQLMSQDREEQNKQTNKQTYIQTDKPWNTFKLDPCCVCGKRNFQALKKSTLLPNERRCGHDGAAGAFVLEAP